MLGLILTLKCSNFDNRFKLRINLNQKKISPYPFKGAGNTINYSSFENAY